MALGLFVVGDEILSGQREDRHFATLRRLLAERGMSLAWVTFLPDSLEAQVSALKQSLLSGHIVFSCGGIGSTPDDHTRQAAALAFNRPLVAHIDACELIAQRCQAQQLELTPSRLAMGELPHGAGLIPNPYNQIPGFFVGQHWFFPGFPAMAEPMMRWVLDEYYTGLFQQGLLQRSLLVSGLGEGDYTPLLELIEKDHPGVNTFSLPKLGTDTAFLQAEVGVKGLDAEMVKSAFEVLKSGIALLECH
ncbi:MAG: hypothetical protein RIQ52_130 [Pseudomonadota bacterium]|jgi:molybdopterin-biosynthesis enzyme MoeA-like protein